MSNLVKHAKEELDRAGFFDEGSDYDGMLGEAVLELIDCFAKQGHSGASAPLTIALFKKVAAFEPITPLTGEDDEWNEVGKGTFQNKRACNVFKDADGQAYNIDGLVFKNQNGCTFTNSYSRVPVSFPYQPKKPTFVDVYVRDDDDE